jgi:hypothetical protein
LEANNVVYRGNRFTGNAGCMQVQMRDATMTNILMENNTGIKEMEFYGKGGGYNCVARNNVGAPGTMRVSCYVLLENNSNLTLQAAGCETNISSAIDTSAFPALRMASPMKDTLFAVAPATIQLEAQVIRGVADSVVFYRDAFTRLGKGIPAADGLWIFTWTPPALDGKYFLTANSYFTPPGGTRVRLKAQPILFEINDGDPFLNNPEDTILSDKPVLARAKGQIFVYPNPTTSQFAIQVPNEEKIDQVEAIDVTGRTQKLISEVGSVWYKSNNLKPGIYFLRIKTNHEIFYSRLVKR